MLIVPKLFAFLLVEIDSIYREQFPHNENPLSVYTALGCGAILTM